VLGDVGAFSRAALPGWGLRGYQLGVARAVMESVEEGLGRSFAVAFSRQSGKDETLAQVLALLLLQRQRRGGSAVVAAPTFRPQAALSRDRLVARLGEPGPRALGAGRARVRDGYVVEVGAASARFLSAAPGANARGQTADLLLVANEAQDIRPEVWDAVFDPMGAATHATTVFMGTVWDRNGLLARQMRWLGEEEARDGARRVWRVDWEAVAAEVPRYGERVRARIGQLGIEHPFIQTEYLLRELDGAGGLFPAGRIAQLQGEHPRRRRGEPGKRYALLVDVAGEEEGAVPGVWLPGSRRDSTALTVVEVDMNLEGRGGMPVYRIVDRMAWTGVRHTLLQAQIADLAREVWRASAVVVDATGVGAGLASFLAAALGDRRAGRGIPVIPFTFTAASKSALGWEVLALIDGGRLKEYADDGEAISREFRAQLGAVEFSTPPGPGHPLRWGVPAGRGHDDLVMSAALAVALDGLGWDRRVAVGT
ncbi:MAG: hypothetical protein ACR2J8_12700, partial [Thermomicrobiales bacterium]